VVAFIDAGQQDIAEMDGPDAVVHFFESDDMLLERVGQKERPRLEPDRAVLSRIVPALVMRLVR
jgi:hypothetical protein